MKHLLVIPILLVAGCSPLTPKEQFLLAGMIAANAADAYTTIQYLDIGGTEANPILGENPSDTSVIMFKGIFTATLYVLGELHPECRETYYTIGMIMGGGAALWNESQYQRYR